MDFGVGYSEIAVILVIALIVIGPRRLPELMRTFGKVVGQLRRMSDDLRREFLFSDDIRSLRQTMTDVMNPLTETKPAPPAAPPRLKLKAPEARGSGASEAAPVAAADSAAVDAAASVAPAPAATEEQNE